MCSSFDVSTAEELIGGCSLRGLRTSVTHPRILAVLKDLTEVQGVHCWTLKQCQVIFVRVLVYHMSRVAQ